MKVGPTRFSRQLPKSDVGHAFRLPGRASARRVAGEKLASDRSAQRGLESRLQAERPAPHLPFHFYVAHPALTFRRAVVAWV